MEKDNLQVDVVIGIDNSYFQKVIKEGIFILYKLENVKYIFDWIIKNFDLEFYLMFYDYGVIVIVYKKNEVLNLFKIFEEFIKFEWKGKFIVENLLMSFMGMVFFFWIIVVYGDKWFYYWEVLRENDVIVVKGWFVGWEMWDKGQVFFFLLVMLLIWYIVCVIIMILVLELCFLVILFMCRQRVLGQ